MPTYTYKHENGDTEEITQRITDEPLTVCPKTGKRIKRIFSVGASIRFKGSGFYSTDYKGK